ncbi:MAG: epoxyqueuosine reductase [Chloroflexi bacterium]|nr:epoxyqueuosine reductase [Chloroflexota bacterium]
MVTRVDSAKAIEAAIKAFVSGSEQNLLGIDGGPIWEEPLVGFADGEDPLFEEYKKIIGSFHLTPRECLEQVGGDSFKAAAHRRTSVICWVLPMASRIRAGNRRRDSAPTIRFVHATRHGEVLNNSLRRYLVSMLTQNGYIAVAPVDSSLFKSFNLPTGRTSVWSERHVLYVAGMGTFSLNDGFITAKGMAMRCGSVVTNLELPASPRVYKGHIDNCPFLVDGSCGDCIDRCPAGAITVKGHDKVKCDQYKRDVLPGLCKFYEIPPNTRHSQSDWIPCGLCQFGVPCESRIPSRKDGPG